MELGEANAVEKAPKVVHWAVGALVLATIFWGCGFTWAKAAGDAVNRSAGVGSGGAMGPIWVLSARFMAGGLLWLVMFPSARRGWDLRSVWVTLLLGGILALGMVVQHWGLDRTSEAVSAFLTSLTILFVPLLMTFVWRKAPKPALWVGVALATAGVWLMTGAAPTGFGLGEALGVGCAIIYSVDIILVNLLVKPEDASRLTAGQFLLVGVLCLLSCLLLPGGRQAVGSFGSLLAMPEVGVNVALLTLLPTIGSFGLQFRFQPHVDPSRAALIYLMEPIFASICAYLVTARRLGVLELLGAALIITANVAAEVLQNRADARAPSTPVID